MKTAIKYLFEIPNKLSTRFQDWIAKLIREWSLTDSVP